ncbi:hypothetical protein C6P40_002376 [Pichia californica]|uniref:Uncharacterized protein n=1 Tax=Pichia californica TaxID=460514 RepID=A0A9P6WJX5_9ASCO|nr:hypothetical protein C6P42_000197 [[Candida] californica]KAG0687418.1 hypothetical protein C6P40_002376 [[Candida] californica]
MILSQSTEGLNRHPENLASTAIGLTHTTQFLEARKSEYLNFDYYDLYARALKILQIQIYLIFKISLTYFCINHPMYEKFVPKKYFSYSPENFLPEEYEIWSFIEDPKFMYRFSIRNYECFEGLFTLNMPFFPDKFNKYGIVTNISQDDDSPLMPYIKSKTNTFKHNFKSKLNLSKSLHRIDSINLEKIENFMTKKFTYKGLSYYDKTECLYSDDVYLHQMDEKLNYKEFCNLLITGHTSNGPGKLVLEDIKLFNSNLTNKKIEKKLMKVKQKELKKLLKEEQRQEKSKLIRSNPILNLDDNVTINRKMDIPSSRSNPLLIDHNSLTTSSRHSTLLSNSITRDDCNKSKLISDANFNVPESALYYLGKEGEFNKEIRLIHLKLLVDKIKSSYKVQNKYYNNSSWCHVELIQKSSKQSSFYSDLCKYSNFKANVNDDKIFYYNSDSELVRKGWYLPVHPNLLFNLLSKYLETRNDGNLHIPRRKFVKNSVIYDPIVVYSTENIIKKNFAVTVREKNINHNIAPVNVDTVEVLENSVEATVNVNENVNENIMRVIIDENAGMNSNVLWADSFPVDESSSPTPEVSPVDAISPNISTDTTVNANDNVDENVENIVEQVPIDMTDDALLVDEKNPVDEVSSPTPEVSPVDAIFPNISTDITVNANDNVDENVENIVEQVPIDMTDDALLVDEKNPVDKSSSPLLQVSPVDKFSPNLASSSFTSHIASNTQADAYSSNSSIPLICTTEDVINLELPTRNDSICFANIDSKISNMDDKNKMLNLPPKKIINEVSYIKEEENYSKNDKNDSNDVVNRKFLNRREDKVPQYILDVLYRNDYSSSSESSSDSHDVPQVNPYSLNMRLLHLVTPSWYLNGRLQAIRNHILNQKQICSNEDDFYLKTSPYILLSIGYIEEYIEAYKKKYSFVSAPENLQKVFEAHVDLLECLIWMVKKRNWDVINRSSFGFKLNPYFSYEEIAKHRMMKTNPYDTDQTKLNIKYSDYILSAFPYAVKRHILELREEFKEEREYYREVSLYILWAYDEVEKYIDNHFKKYAYFHSSSDNRDDLQSHYRILDCLNWIINHLSWNRMMNKSIVQSNAIQLLLDPFASAEENTENGNSLSGINDESKNYSDATNTKKNVLVNTSDDSDDSSQDGFSIVDMYADM